ncbi:hypothetical protein CEXT_641471 [Caerostris extrusa]|uniref:Uncharacterized protein n=1 Tax=Caerostris extrusa TaxID=172846 RepID=A0AAV4SIX5_CAEEX|nr:hypothetical protein CEXT_641471 [Caerostris extrusa]
MRQQNLSTFHFQLDPQKYHPHPTHCSPLKLTQIQKRLNQSPPLQTFPEKRIKKINTKMLFSNPPILTFLSLPQPVNLTRPQSLSSPNPSPFSTTNPPPLQPRSRGHLELTAN